MKIHFRDFKVYKDSRELIVLVLQETRKFPKEFRYLSGQINRSTLSIVLNIAEGSAKGSDKDFNRYIKNSLGSATELSAALEVSCDLGLVSKKAYGNLENKVESIIKQLGGFSKYLSKS